MSLHVDQVLSQQLQNQGIDSTVGVYGDHKLQIGNGKPIALDKIQANSVPREGFRRTEQIRRGKVGLETSANDTMKALTNPTGKFDAKAILGSIMAAKIHLGRMEKLGQLQGVPQDSTMWIFSNAVENLSNEDLARVYQTFTSKQMDLLQAALGREVQINSKADDAAFAAEALFDLNALIVKEVNNRAMACQIKNAIEQTNNLQERENLDAMMPKSITETYGEIGNPPGSGFTRVNPNRRNETDMTAMNLMTLVELSSSSATLRANNAPHEAKRLANRNVDGVTVTQMADVMRNAELTINVPVDVLFKDTFILKKPNQAILNIFQLKQQGMSSKSDEYIGLRDTAEKKVFPEFEGHELDPAERPVYGALNVKHHGKGAVADGEYGNVCIVLKDNVKKRSTFSSSDTFFAPKLKINAQTKETFYKLLDGSGVSPMTAQILRDPNSEAHKKFELMLDRLALDKNSNTTAFKTGGKTTGLNLTDAEDEKLRTLLFKCFVDTESTRSNMTTYENMESLVTGLDDVDGNMLADAAKRSREGGNGMAVLSGGRYIEAQIHGPIVPSRDIAEIRVDISELESLYTTPEELENAKAELQAFTRETGIPVIITNLDDTIDEQSSTIRQNVEEHSAQHIDREAAEQALAEKLETLDERIRLHVFSRTIPPVENLEFTDADKELIVQRARENLESQIAHPTATPEAATLANEAVIQAIEQVARAKTEAVNKQTKTLVNAEIAKIGQTFREFTAANPELTGGRTFQLSGKAEQQLIAQLRMNVNEALKTTMHPEGQLEQIVQTALRETISAQIAEKMPLLEKLDELHPQEGPEKQAARALILSDGSGMSPERFGSIDQSAGLQFSLLNELTGAQPASSHEQIVDTLQMITTYIHETAGLLGESFNEIKGTAQTAANLALAKFMGTEPPPSLETVKALRDQIDSPQMRNLLSMLKTSEQFAADPQHGTGVQFFIDTVESLGQALCEKAREMDVAAKNEAINSLPENEQGPARERLETAERPYAPSAPFAGEANLIQAETRTLIEKLSPQLAQALNEKAPAVAPFPEASNNAALPQNLAQRKQFMINHMDLYLNHEKTFERGTSVHGRGHIARAFIFANTMSNILVSMGVKVDKNAVLLGIAGHDSGRQGGNKDRWEGRSANITVNLIKQDYGENTMGEEYSKEVEKCIVDHQSPTVEGMLLNAADSLDIGRTQDFKPQYFNFLKNAGTAQAEQIRQELIREADLLQRLTNPLCANRQLMNKLADDAGDEDKPMVIQELASDQLKELQGQIGAQFIADWEVPNDEYFARFENEIRNNPQMFPLMSKYYFMD